LAADHPADCHNQTQSKGDPDQHRGHPAKAAPPEQFHHRC